MYNFVALVFIHESLITYFEPIMAYLSILFSCLFGLYSPVLPQQNVLDHVVGITINAEPITAFEIENPSLRHFGLLEFRGGLVLKSSQKSFGGFSALRVQPDGEHFIALSDRASWLRGRIVYKDNRPMGIADAEMAPVLDADGKPAPRWDTESITEDKGTLYVGLERIHSIVSFDYARLGLLAPGQPVPGPPELKDLPFNQSLEAIVFVPKKFRLRGTLIAFSERGLTEAGNLKAFLIGGATPGMFSVKRTDEYDISDAAMLPKGDILILERKFSLESGVSMRIRCIRLDAIKPGAVVDGLIIIEADKRHQLDNMEALGIHRTRSGEVVLTLMSDNNFSSIQRTLLLQFVLKER
jgi:hypothetical protein